MTYSSNILLTIARCLIAVFIAIYEPHLIGRAVEAVMGDDAEE